MRLCSIPVIGTFAYEEKQVVPVDLVIRLKQKMPDKEVCPISRVLVGRVEEGSRVAGLFGPQIFSSPKRNLLQQLLQGGRHDDQPI